MVEGRRPRQRGGEQFFCAGRAHVGVVVVAVEGELGLDGAEAGPRLEGGFLGEHVLECVRLVFATVGCR